MKTIRLLSTVATTLLLAVGCSKADDTADYQNTRIQINGQITPIAKASDAGFGNGDAIGVFVSDNSNESTPGAFTASRAVNVKHTKDASGWTASSAILWTDNTTKATVWGIYPYDATMTAASATYTFTVQNDQNRLANPEKISGYEASDLLWASTPAPVAPTKDAIQLNFSHALSKISLTLAKTDDLTTDITTGVTVTVGELPLTALVNMTDGSISSTSGTGAITARKSSDYIYEAIVAPSTVSNLKFSVEAGGTIYECIFPTAMFTPGKQHNYKLTLSNRPGIEITDNGITDWIGKGDKPTDGDATPNS